ncbi:ECF transporter S component [Bacillus kwashiorkori]|uniref:ECF transporter S component n=1 Tax=Bacillus kwashiorkori TaxID=1522318 RepID=UPI000782D4ED|nr:ECF transporter S component [Bacillus kwashiorkori]
MESYVKHKKGYSRFIIILISVAFIALIISCPNFIINHFYLTSVIFLVISFFPLFLRFEKRKVSSRELVILAILAAIAAVSRIPFASIPSVQPTTFVIIMTAIVFGAESGFVVGALAAIVSNLFLGQGPWTPWQMYGWGMIGLVAGLLNNSLILQNKFSRILFGFFAGIIFGWIMNLWVIFSMGTEFNFKSLLVFYTTSFPHDLAHGLSNAFFLAVFGNSWLKTLRRFQRKYGLLL